MKRNYSKPVFAVESFQVDAAVAGSCGGPGYLAIGHAIGSCWTNTDDKYVFADYPCEFIVDMQYDAENNKPCYHGPFATAEGKVYLCS